MTSTRPSMASPTQNNSLIAAVGILLLLVLAAVSLFTGKVDIRLTELLKGNPVQWKLFLTLRVGRVTAAVLGGASLGIAGWVFQTVFRNPLASPDVIGVASGASAGAAFGILFLGGTWSVMASSFSGAVLAVVMALLLAALDREGRRNTVVLSGIAVHSLFQTALMALKLAADPERELQSIEYWLMGSLSGVSMYTLWPALSVMVPGLAAIALLSRQVLLLSNEEGEARTLGVNAPALRLLVLGIATLLVASVISNTGLIAFVGLMAPHIARKLLRGDRRGILFLSGLTGALLLCGADILARTAAATELPVSIFLSLLGAPFLIVLAAGRRKNP